MKSILEYLENSAQIYPDKAAMEDEKESCTYRELEQSGKAIGSILGKVATPRMPIPMLMDKNVMTVKCFMGAVYAGCFYSLLDPKHPTVRLQQILETLDAKVLLVDRKFERQLEKVGFDGKIIYTDELNQKEIDELLLQKIRNQTMDTDPLYINFTSGSTGVPKGVAVCHRSVIDFINYFTDLFHITDQDIIGNQAPLDFDVSVKDLYSTLKTGATMELIPKKMFSFPTKLLDFLVEREVTTLIWAVSALCIITTLKGFDYKLPTKINKVMFSGEVMPIKHLNLWKKSLPDVTYVNLYGPTEITCNCSYYIIDREFEIGEILPIGEPFPNERVFLLDGDEMVEEKDRLGEICVAGTALALGYYNNPEQTARAFVQNPLNPYYPEIIYRTGDLGRYNEKGELFFASRKDFQIKHMGHRIELGEIETAIEKLDGIERICCIFVEEKNKIFAFYEGELEKRQIVKQLGQVLPVYMIPNVFQRVEQMPITDNGKIDRKKLLKENVDAEGNV